MASGTWALPSLVGVDLWQTVGITFTIFLVELQTIPSALCEAAAIDGVGPFQRFRFITFPMLTPATLVASVTAFIGAFKIFTWPYVITSGGPGNATLTIMVYIFRVSIRNLELTELPSPSSTWWCWRPWSPSASEWRVAGCTMSASNTAPVTGRASSRLA